MGQGSLRAAGLLMLSLRERPWSPGHSRKRRNFQISISFLWCQAVGCSSCLRHDLLTSPARSHNAPWSWGPLARAVGDRHHDARSRHADWHATADPKIWPSKAPARVRSACPWQTGMGFSSSHIGTHRECNKNADLLHIRHVAALQTALFLLAWTDAAVAKHMCARI